MDWIIELFSGAAGASIVAGVFALVHNRKKRKDSQSEALRYLMLYVIQERAKQHIKEGKITLEERRLLHKWHLLYHNGLNGNGDADTLMLQIDQLWLDTKD